MTDFYKQPYQFTQCVEATLPSSNNLVVLYFDIKQATTLVEVNFQGELSAQEHHLFQLCCQIVSGMSLEDILLLSWSDLLDYDEQLAEQAEQEQLPLVCYPLWIMQSAVAKIMGTKIPEIKNDLICFCFSISKQEIIHFFKQNPQATLLDVTKQLNAGGACQSCLGQLEQLLIQQRKSGGDYSQLDIEMIEDVLWQWQELESYFKLGLIHLKEWNKKELLVFQVQNPDKFNDLTWKIENYLFEKLGLYFVIRFEHFT